MYLVLNDAFEIQINIFLKENKKIIIIFAKHAFEV